MQKPWFRQSMSFFIAHFHKYVDQNLREDMLNGVNNIYKAEAMKLCQEREKFVVIRKYGFCEEDLVNGRNGIDSIMI